MNQYQSINPNFPPIVKNLIIINVLAWIASISLPKFGIDLVDLLGLHYWESSQFNAIQLVTYMFLHDTSSITH
ncbi:MAG: rhomboid family intramembrane serine protease, partial [Paludibacteraceae bacterium]|nr:rhomboid family intramembrane serine protease [Paludibacteraceae bacterium]